MTVKIGINGFGRVAKACLRASFERADMDVVAVNSIRKPEFLAHLFKYDSVYGIFEGEVEARGQSLVINGRQVRILAERDPSLLPWGSEGVEVVLEATGSFNQRAAAAQHLRGGAKKVIITAPGKDVDLTVVMGVNEKKYDPTAHYIISNASCTTNCLAVMCKVLQEQIGIKRALMTTIHSYTNDQRLLDITHTDFRRARAAAVSMIPTTTGAARNVGLVLPELAGKINGIAIRIPTFAVSLVDLVAEVGKGISVEALNRIFKEASQQDLAGFLDVSDQPLVSIDYKQNSFSAVVDALSTMIVGEKLIKVLGWYDNEWGYACRTLDLAAYLAKCGL